MKKLTTILFVVALFIAANISAQDVFVAKWDLMFDSLTTSVVGNVDAPEQILAGGLTVKDYYTGSFGTAQRVYFHNELWPLDGGPNPERYIEFKVSPKAGYNMTVDNVVYSFGCYGTRGYMHANTYWDTNPTFATKVIVDTTSAGLNDFRDSALVVHNYQVNAEVKDGKTFYLRIFPWYTFSPSSATKYIVMSDLIITGSTTIAVGVDEEVLPSEFALEQNYPNPFNPTTEIQFAIPKEGNYSLKVFNLLGQEVSTLVNGQLNPGIHNVNFDAGKLTSGMYIYQLTGNNVNISKKMLLMK